MFNVIFKILYLKTINNSIKKIKDFLKYYVSYTDRDESYIYNLDENYISFYICYHLFMLNV